MESEATGIPVESRQCPGVLRTVARSEELLAAPDHACGIRQQDRRADLRVPLAEVSDGITEILKRQHAAIRARGVDHFRCDRCAGFGAVLKAPSVVCRIDERHSETSFNGWLRVRAVPCVPLPSSATGDRKRLAKELIYR